MRPAERSRALSAPAAERVECAVCARASAPELRACCWLEPAAAALVLPCAVPSSTALATAAVPGARGLATLSHTRSLLSRHCVCACRREPRRLARTHTVLYLANRLLLFNKGQSHAQQTTEYDMYRLRPRCTESSMAGLDRHILPLPLLFPLPARRYRPDRCARFMDEPILTCCRGWVAQHTSGSPR